MRREHGILYYARYKDDAILITRELGLENLQTFFSNLRLRAHPFILNVESVSRHNVFTLDVEWFKGNRYSETSTLDFRLFVKPTSLWTHLSPHSEHHPNVHLSWPASQMRRIAKRHSCKYRAADDIQKFKQQFFVACGLNLEDHGSRCASYGKPNLGPGISWMVLPWYSAWRSSKIGHAIRHTMVPVSLRDMLGIERASVSWSNGSKHLLFILRA